MHDLNKLGFKTRLHNGINTYVNVFGVKRLFSFYTSSFVDVSLSSFILTRWLLAFSRLM